MLISMYLRTSKGKR